MVDTRAILAPTFETYMGLRQGSYRRSLPGKIALDPIGAEDHGGATVAVAVTSRFMLPGIANIKDADGPHEIELRSTDIDVRAILNAPEGSVGGNDIVDS
ncbi:MAG: hypothetical protein HoeaKO_33360 [Hoeflea alexandrii]